MRHALFTMLVVGSLVAGGCAGGDEEPESPQPAALTTPEPIRNAVWERSYSECASYDVFRLSEKYRVARDRQQVAAAVGKDWAEFFGGGDDAARVGRDGCLEGFRAG